MGALCFSIVSHRSLSSLSGNLRPESVIPIWPVCLFTSTGWDVFAAADALLIRSAGQALIFEQVSQMLMNDISAQQSSEFVCFSISQRGTLAATIADDNLFDRQLSRLRPRRFGREGDRHRVGLLAAKQIQ